MGLVRTILFLVLGVLLYRLWRRWWDARSARMRSSPQDQGHMVACKHCGLYLPEQDAFKDGDDFYCSDAHRRADTHA